MPEDTRKNPQSDEDKQKVKSLKDELIGLNKKMKESIGEESAMDKQKTKN